MSFESQHDASGRLESYLDATRRRLRSFFFARAGLCVAATLLVVSVLGIWLLQRQGFPSTQVAIWRVGLLVAVIAVALALIWPPLVALRRAHGAHELERRLPAQQGRIGTYLELRSRAAAEGTGNGSPFLDLLAEDALQVAERPDGSLRISARHVALLVAGGAVLFGGLVALLVLPGSPWGYGGRHLLLGAELPKAAVRTIELKPGNATLRRNGDLRVHAIVKGFVPDKAELVVRFADSNEWERAPMQAGKDGAFDFTLFALRAPLSYYVVADNVESKRHAVQVVDLPRVEKVVLKYQHPSWTGLAPSTDEDSRDIFAVEGTRVALEVTTDLPLESPALVVDGASGGMKGAGMVSNGELTVAKPGSYHIAARVAGELVPLTDDYTIELRPDEKPTIEIVKPGRDARASAIEEVPVQILATDDFRVARLELHYSVNGGKWQTVELKGGGQNANDTALLALEQLGQDSAGKGQALTPGDLVSYYALARDRAQAAQTDLFMVQVQAFDRRFTQGQAGGGGGGGGGAEEQDQISERQREILLATWNLQRARSNTDAERRPRDGEDGNSEKRSSDSARMLGELQQTLAQQTRTLAQRTRAREVDEDPQVKEFVAHLDAAAEAMDPASKHLNAVNLGDAIPVEQQALQHLKRAEATFRDIQVMRQQGGGGGGGGGGQQAADINELF